MFIIFPLSEIEESFGINTDFRINPNSILTSGGSRISRRGGVDLVGAVVDSRGGYVSKILYVKTKESGPLGGRAPGTPP